MRGSDVNTPDQALSYLAEFWVSWPPLWPCLRFKGKMILSMDTNYFYLPPVVNEDISCEIKAIERACELIRSGRLIDLRASISGLSDVNCPNKHGNTLAMVAAWNGQVQALKMLFENGADLSNPLVSIMAARSSSVLEYLSQKDILQTNAKDKNGTTPLQQACNICTPGSHGLEYDLDQVEDRIMCINFLIASGAEINASNNFGRTALHGVAACPSINLIEALLVHSPDTDIPCKQGKKPISYSFNEEIEAVIRRHIISITI